METLRRIDATITEIIATAFGTLYEFHDKWERSDIEGPVFVVRRAAGFALVVLNRLSLTNYVETLEFTNIEKIDSYLIWKDSTIRCLWFHSSDDLARISKAFEDCRRPSGLLTPARLNTVDVSALRTALLDLINDDAFLAVFHQQYLAKTNPR